ncbi:hypothetical protein BGW38_005308, partial [Lunasporangiospora selenospora]
WRDQDGECHGYARKYPTGFPFGTLDGKNLEGHDSRHYQQKSGNRNIACSFESKNNDLTGQDETRQNPISKSYGGNYGKMASTKAGDTMCVRWPAKNHAVKSQKDSGVFINMPQAILNKDPDQDGFTAANLVNIPYKNCTIIGDDDKTPCGGCFQIPPTLQTGNYVMQWRWELNKDEWYTSCWDLDVTAPEPIDKGSNNNNNDNNDNNKTVTGSLGGSTSVFAELAELPVK